MSLACRTADPGSQDHIPAGHVTSIEVDHEIIYTVIPFLMLTQEGQLSVTDKSMHTKY